VEFLVVPTQCGSGGVCKLPRFQACESPSESPSSFTEKTHQESNRRSRGRRPEDGELYWWVYGDVMKNMMILKKISL
jgi:hypothetical protein